MPSPAELWAFLPWGYLLTITLETPVLLIGLSRRHGVRDRLLAGIWLTACTYPVVVLVLPILLGQHSRMVYLLVAETFAPVAECALFWAGFGSREQWWQPSMWRDFAAIVAANLVSFLLGGWLVAWIVGG